jgi:AhpD family alkylhydroperoxidase
MSAETDHPMHAAKPRLALARVVPEVHKAMLAADAAIEHVGIEKALLELVRVRASQFNGCAFCIDMHTKDARAGGEGEQRIYALNAWRETPFFSDRERAALALTEAMTCLQATVSDEVYEQAAQQFASGDLAALVGAIAMINAWNRIAIATRMPAGRYQPGAKKALTAGDHR